MRSPRRRGTTTAQAVRQAGCEAPGLPWVVDVTARPLPAGELPQYLRRLGITPRQALGQHFLVDELMLARIADACALDGGLAALEIGAGAGGLTEELARRAGRVVAVEIDEELAALTRERLREHRGLCVLAADVLEFTPAELLAECGVAPPYVACGNLPYYITQPIVRRLLAAEPRPERVVVMMQREVARRIVGGPGRQSLLSLSTACYGRAEGLFDVPAEAFWPSPKVQSAVVRIEPGPGLATELSAADLERFQRLLRAGFAEPRKQLHNSLRASLDLSREQTVALLEAVAIDPALRPQHLALADWRLLFDAVEQRHPQALDVA